MIKREKNYGIQRKECSKKKEQQIQILGNRNNTVFKETKLLNMNWVIINKGRAEADDVGEKDYLDPLETKWRIV